MTNTEKYICAFVLAALSKFGSVEVATSEGFIRFKIRSKNQVTNFSKTETEVEAFNLPEVAAKRDVESIV